MIWAMVGKVFGFMWKYLRLVLIGAVCATVFGLWLLSARRADTIEKLKGRITLLETVLSEYENAQLEMDGKVTYEKNSGQIKADSAAAVAAGRLNGDGPLAPVLRTEYERVQRLAKTRAADTR